MSKNGKDLQKGDSSRRSLKKCLSIRRLSRVSHDGATLQEVIHGYKNGSQGVPQVFSGNRSAYCNGKKTIESVLVQGKTVIPEVDKLFIWVLADNYYDSNRADEKNTKRYRVVPRKSIHTEHELSF